MNYFKAGKLVAVHGLKGELIFKHELGKKTSLKDLKAIIIEERKDSIGPDRLLSEFERSHNYLRAGCSY
jgi:ribosomal 30S subunit maturation factor RimM